MPKDLTKQSLKELDRVGEGELERRMRWNDGRLELSVAASAQPGFGDDDYSDD